jgi:tRNA(Ile2) C34 agmatinyltransferase TiaS
MAENRICPACGESLWSADTRNDWRCPECGAVVPKERDRYYGGDVICRMEN